MNLWNNSIHREARQTVNKLHSLIRKEMNIAVALEYDTPLLSSGFISSFRVTKLLLVLEKHDQIDIDPAEVGVDNFDTIDQIHRFIEHKKNSGASNRLK